MPVDSSPPPSSSGPGARDGDAERAETDDPTRTGDATSAQSDDAASEAERGATTNTKRDAAADAKRDAATDTESDAVADESEADPEEEAAYSTTGAVPVVQHELDDADLRMAAAAASARAETVRRGAEARARRLRDEARARIESRRAEAGTGARGAATARSDATDDGAHRATSHDRQPRRRVAVRVRTLVLSAIAIALVAGLVGGLLSWLLIGPATGSRGPGLASPGVGGATAGSSDVHDAAAFAMPSVVSVHVSSTTRQEVGSGVVLREDGLVLTNAHVVTLDGTTSDADMTATDASGMVYTATLVGLDPLADLAVVQLQGASEMTPATWGDSSSLTVGDPTVVLGSPLGLAGTVTSGVVSTTARSIEIVSAAVPPSADTDVDPTDAPGLTPQPAPPGASTIHLAVFQTDAAINPGNSGGPVVNLRGEVVGVAVAIATTARASANPGVAGSIGLGFAIPGNVAQRVAQDLVEGRTPSHGALGASIMSSTSVASDGPTAVGAYVDEVTADGAAARAGIGPGDVITSIEGLPVTGPGDLIAFVRLFEAGEKVELTVVRADTPLKVDVTLDSAA